MEWIPFFLNVLKLIFFPSHSYKRLQPFLLSFLCTALFNIKGFFHKKKILYYFEKKSREIAFSEFLGRIMILLFFSSFILLYFTPRGHINEKIFFSSFLLLFSIYWGIKLKCRSDKSPLANINRIEIKIFMFLNWQRVFQSSYAFSFHCRSFSFATQIFLFFFFLMKRILCHFMHSIRLFLKWLCLICK